jgi:exo-beta-1,3-glucanase (GH17 family)
MQAAADGGLRNRLVYLTTPAGEVNPDRTNEDLVTHWHEFRQDLRVINPESFVAAHDHFYLLHSDQSTDVITPWLMRTFRLRAVWNIVDDKDHRNVWLFEATSR